MKNIFLLPTDKVSVLYKRNDLNTLHLGDFDICKPNDELRTNYYIYITNDEKIKDDEYYLSWQDYFNPPKFVIYVKVSGVNGNGKKIILTNDPKLIEDGVQAIDDEFLGWFVENPSCEFVKTESLNVGDGKLGYIICKPQEKTKQENLEIAVKKLESDCLKTLRNHGVELSDEAVCTINQNGIELGISAIGKYAEKGYKMAFASNIELYAKTYNDKTGLGRNENEIDFGSSGSFNPSNRESYWRTIHASSILKNWGLASDIVNLYCRKYLDLVYQE